MFGDFFCLGYTGGFLRRDVTARSRGVGEDGVNSYQDDDDDDEARSGTVWDGMM